MYNCKSKMATEFIDDQEIMDTIAYAQANKSNRELIDSIFGTREGLQRINSP